MLRGGILNPAINSLLSRVRHTNTLVIADRGLPYWPQVEVVDISLVDNVPRVADVLRAVQANFMIGKAFMAEEFRQVNDRDTVLATSLRATSGWLCSVFRAARRVQEAGSFRNRPHPDSRYDSVR